MNLDRNWRWDAILLLVLAGLGGSAKAWLVNHTEVMAKDGITHIQYAVRLDAEDWRTVMRDSEYHPLYPIHVWAASKVLPPKSGESAPMHWQRSAQWANWLLGVLLVCPMYLLGRDLFGRTVGFWATLSFQLLPVPARILADALSEGAFLFWVSSAILFAVWGLRSSQMYWFGLSGASGGLAYLARPEAGIVLACIGLMTALTPLLREAGAAGSRWRISWGGSAALIAGALIFMGPFWLTIGRLTTKPTANQMLETAAVQAGPLLAARFTPGANGVGVEGVSTGYALSQVADELVNSFHYVAWIPALLGVVAVGRRWRNGGRQEPWPHARQAYGLLVLIVVAYVIVLGRLALVAGYVSERHTLVILLVGLYFAVAGTAEMTTWCLSWMKRRVEPLRAARSGATRPWWYNPANLTALMILLVLAAGGWRTFRPMHPHRAGHKQAGLWLKERMQSGDELVDPHGWAAFYSGYALEHPRRAEPRPPGAVTRYVVREPADTDTTRQQIIQQATGGRDLGPPVFQWSQPKAPTLEVNYLHPEGP